MIHRGNATIERSQIGIGIRRGLSAAAGALAAALAALVIAPATAQNTGSISTGKRSDDVATKKTKPSGTSGTMRRASKNQKVMTPSRAVLVFPTDAKGGISDQLSDIITETIQGRISASGRYQSVYFLRSIPTVQRALNEATLTANEVSHPFDDDTKLRKLMPNSGYDMALTTSVDSYNYDAAKNQVTLLISARLIDYRGDKPVVRAAAENGSSPASGGNVREIVHAQQVAKSITEKLMTSLLSQDKPMAGPAAPAGK